METLRKLLDAECDHKMMEETMNMFLGLMTQVQLKNKEPLIPYGKLDNNIYVVKEGIIRYAYFDGERERTFGFATPGTLMISYHSFYKHVPSVFQLESCGRSVVMKVANAKVHELLGRSNDFALWMLKMQAFQLYAWEMKTVVISGSAAERFDALVKNRTEILKKVSGKVVASYIGVNQPYLSRLKRQFLLKFKK